ncbi:MAG: hypothetical protein ACR2P4_02565 [Gammaproteobacteria bacterium]
MKQTSPERATEEKRRRFSSFPPLPSFSRKRESIAAKRRIGCCCLSGFCRALPCKRMGRPFRAILLIMPTHGAARFRALPRAMNRTPFQGFNDDYRACDY